MTQQKKALIAYLKTDKMTYGIMLRFVEVFVLNKYNHDLPDCLALQGSEPPLDADNYIEHAEALILGWAHAYDSGNEEHERIAFNRLMAALRYINMHYVADPVGDFMAVLTATLDGLDEAGWGKHRKNSPMMAQSHFTVVGGEPVIRYLFPELDSKRFHQTVLDTIQSNNQDPTTSTIARPRGAREYTS